MDHFLVALTAFISALTGLLTVLTRLKLKKMNRNINGRMEESIRLHRADAYQQGITAGLNSNGRRGEDRSQ